MNATLPLLAPLFATPAPDGHGLGAPHPALRRHEFAGRGAVWSTRSDVERQHEEILEYFALGAYLPASARVVDVGAHCGLFSLEVAARSPGAEVVLIEPIPLFQEAICRNLRESFMADRLSSNTRLHRFGVAREASDTTIDFTYFARLPTDTTCRATDKYAEFRSVFAHHALALKNRIAETFPGRVGEVVAAAAHDLVVDIPEGGWKKQLFDRAIGAERVEARVVPLSTILESHPGPIDLLKIDCEGSELVALESVSHEDFERIEQVVLEANGGPDERRAILELLRARGMEIVTEATPMGAEEQGLSSYLVYARRPAW